MQVVGGEVGDEREDGETHFVVLHIRVVIPSHADSTALSMACYIQFFLLMTIRMFLRIKERVTYMIVTMPSSL
jgi:hypothetical protein